VAIYTPIAFTRFCKAFACDMAVGPVLAAFSSASRRVVYVCCVTLADDRPLTYYLHCSLNLSVASN
jgi:hypothetical protein